MPMIPAREWSFVNCFSVPSRQRYARQRHARRDPTLRSTRYRTLEFDRRLEVVAKVMTYLETEPDLAPRSKGPTRQEFEVLVA
jgi:hypothetical protein